MGPDNIANIVTTARTDCTVFDLSSNARAPQAEHAKVTWLICVQYDGSSTTKLVYVVVGASRGVC